MTESQKNNLQALKILTPIVMILVGAIIYVNVAISQSEIKDAQHDEKIERLEKHDEKA